MPYYFKTSFESLYAEILIAFRKLYQHPVLGGRFTILKIENEIYAKLTPVVPSKQLLSVLKN